MISFVYGSPYQKHHSDFLLKLADFGVNNVVPWLCIGDFNAIAAQTDKLGGHPFNGSFSNNFMNTFGMIDLGFYGNPYTWLNHRQGHSLIKERLDWEVASCQWIHLFPSFSITHLPAHTSNHNPLILDIAIPSPSFPRSFCFEEFWIRNPTYGTVINETWSSTIVGSLAYYFIRNLKNTKKAIKFWNKHHFGDIRRKMDTTLRLLDITQQAIPSDSNLALEFHLKSLLNEYLIQEESLWKNKSRELWLTFKNLNTIFFHTSTLIRRRKNVIDCLKSTNDGWITDRNAIDECCLKFQISFCIL